MNFRLAQLSTRQLCHESLPRGAHINYLNASKLPLDSQCACRLENLSDLSVTLNNLSGFLMDMSIQPIVTQSSKAFSPRVGIGHQLDSARHPVLSQSLQLTRGSMLQIPHSALSNTVSYLAAAIDEKSS